MGCRMINPQMKHFIYDLCWVDRQTLIVADHIGGQLVMYNINITAKTCEGRVIKYMPWVSSVSCSQGGKVLTSANDGKEVKILMYDAKTQRKRWWDTDIRRNNEIVRISENQDCIVIYRGREGYIFTKDRVLYNVTHFHALGHFYQVHVTAMGMLWGTSQDNKLLIINLVTNETNTINQGIVEADGVTGTSNGYVYVTDVNAADVGVYQPNGTFLHKLQINRPEGAGGLRYSAALTTSDNEALIAFSTWDVAFPIAVYMMGN